MRYTILIFHQDAAFTQRDLLHKFVSDGKTDLTAVYVYSTS